ncbi:MAG TPA: glycine cleavage system protein GcvH [Candidatus Acidoferrales bacterium]|nr:glycine cleavage system protein GcvH [Candidatus Acidoferrales bacterium]
MGKERKMYPADFRYSKDHEWIQVSGGVGTIGITDYAQHSLGDVVFVELPKTGTKVKAGDTLGTVESVKAVSEVFSPVSGEVTDVNSELSTAPEKINQDPHKSAWLVKIKLADEGEAAKLMDAKAYTEYVAEKEKEQTA